MVLYLLLDGILAAIPILALMVCIGALIASVAGTFVKRYGQDLPLIRKYHTSICATAYLVFLYFLEVPFIHVTTSYILGMAWQILAVSFGAYVMLILLQRGTANQTSNLLFLIACRGSSMACTWRANDSDRCFGIVPCLVWCVSSNHEMH